MSQFEIKPICFNVRDAALFLNCSRFQIYALIEKGELEAFRDGRIQKVLVSSIDKFIAKHRVQPKARATEAA
jgi:excisionase family DNA binding protein